MGMTAEWVSIDAGLPDPDPALHQGGPYRWSLDVLVMSAEFGILMCYARTNKVSGATEWRITASSGGDVIDDVTHWRNLPDPPDFA